MTPGKTIALTTWTFVGIVMSLLFNMLFFQGASVLWFHGCSHHLQWFWHTPKIVCHYFHCFCIICHEVMGPDAMIFVFWMFPFKPTFSLSSFTYIKRLFSSSLFSAIRIVSSPYLRLLINKWMKTTNYDYCHYHHTYATPLNPSQWVLIKRSSIKLN